MRDIEKKKKLFVSETVISEKSSTFVKTLHSNILYMLTYLILEEFFPIPALLPTIGYLCLQKVQYLCITIRF